MKTTFQWFGMVVATGVACVCGAQPATSKPVRLIVPYAPGGVADLMSRILAQRLGALYNQQVIVDNRPGSGGHLGAEVTADVIGKFRPELSREANKKVYVIMALLALAKSKDLKGSLARLIK